jgi:iron complex transport system ATP-binding protein
MGSGQDERASYKKRRNAYQRSSRYFPLKNYSVTVIKIHIRDLEFRYAADVVLKDIRLEMMPGECVAIVGPNGAGKSTLIRCINGLLKPQKGVINIDHQNIETLSRKQIARKLSYVPQSTGTTFPLSVFDMLLLGRKPHVSWNSGNHDKHKVLTVLKRLNIEHLALKNFNELSGGQQQKVIIARALVQETDVLLLDEPISNLDIRHQLEVMDIIRKLVDDTGILAIMIVHDLNIAARYSDRIIMMDNGRVVVSGPPEDVLVGEKISSVYNVEVEVSMSGIDKKPYIVPLNVMYA